MVSTGSVNSTSSDDFAIGYHLSDDLRANLYGILARLLGQELSSAFFNELQEIGFLDLLAAMDEGFTAPENNRTINHEFMATEYARLFIGPGPHVPPYASVHREDDTKAGELWGDSTGEVKRFMDYYGLKSTAKGIIPDHISVLFEFMERLIHAGFNAVDKKDPDAALNANDIQKRFFNDYIAPWIGKYICRVKDMKPDAFFASVVRLTDLFVDFERKKFSEGS